MPVYLTLRNQGFFIHKQIISTILDPVLKPLWSKIRTAKSQLIAPLITAPYEWMYWRTGVPHPHIMSNSQGKSSWRPITGRIDQTLEASSQSVGLIALLSSVATGPLDIVLYSYELLTASFQMCAKLQIMIRQPSRHHASPLT